MIALKYTVIHLALIGFYYGYAANLPDNISADQLATKHIAYVEKEGIPNNITKIRSEATSYNQLKKRQKRVIHRSASINPRLVVLTTPISSDVPESIESDSTNTEDDEQDEFQSFNRDFINVYEKKVLDNNNNLMIPTTLVRHEKW
jgi:hypothetical protein